MKIITFILAYFVFGIFLIKWFWAWTIPEIFPEAVKQNLIAETISWWTALKFSILLSIITAVTTIRKEKGR
ncbi:MAG: hypothetical protein Fur0012_11760 [Elusimicrobiota bacterium]